MLAGRTLLDYNNLFSPNEYKNNDKIIHKYFKDKYVKLEFRLKQIDETRNYLLEETKHNNLMNEKYLAFAYLSFNSYCLCLNFIICFISLCSCWY